MTSSDHQLCNPETRTNPTEQLIRNAGFDPVFVGGLEQARALEDAVGLFGALRRLGGGPHFHRFARPGEL